MGMWDESVLDRWWKEKRGACRSNTEMSAKRKHTFTLSHGEDRRSDTLRRLAAMGYLRATIIKRKIGPNYSSARHAPSDGTYQTLAEETSLR